MPELDAMKSTQNKKGRDRAQQQETRKCRRGETKKDKDNDRKGKDKDATRDTEETSVSAGAVIVDSVLPFLRKSPLGSSE